MNFSKPLERTGFLTSAFSSMKGENFCSHSNFAGGLAGASH